MERTTGDSGKSNLLRIEKRKLDRRDLAMMIGAKKPAKNYLIIKVGKNFLREERRNKR